MWNVLNLSRGKILVLAVILLITNAVPAGAFFLPDTGQTTCYSDKGMGKVIACPPPEDQLAQDGSYIINPQSYTINSNGTVSDNNTWLMWQQQDDGGFRTWDGANSYCENLNLGGYTDWRLPAKEELESIVNYGQYNPAIDSTVFPNTKSYNYWSSTAYPSRNASAAFYVHFGSGIEFSDTCTWKRRAGGGGWGVEFEYLQGGNVNFNNKTNGYYVRCVRGGPLVFGNFMDNGNSTVTDLSTGLTWQQGETESMKWGAALGYCEGLSLGGYSDWRLPDVRELESLIDNTRVYPSINTTFFPNVYSDNYCSDYQSFFYWTSTSSPSDTDNKLTVSFERGFTTSHNKRDRDNFVRCVQGGNTALDKWEINVNPSALNFDSVEAGGYKSLNLTVTNIGIGNLVIETITGPSVPFSIISDGCSGQTLSSSASCSVAVKFAPTVEGTFTGVLTIPSNDADNPSVTVNLSGTAMVPSATIAGTVTDSFTGLTLSDVVVTVTDALKTHTVTTDANGAYTVTGLAQGGFTATLEKSGYISQTVTGTLTAGQTLTLNIQLAPTIPLLTIAISSPQDGAVVNSSPATVSGNVSNNAIVTVNGIQASVSNNTFSASIPLSEGQNTITASATDQYGQTASQSIDVTLMLPKPPVIGNVAVSNITTDSATISWTTDQESDSLVEYGTTASYGSSEYDSALATNHSITLINLISGTTYHYKITSANAYGLSSYSEDNIFITLSPITITITSPLDGESISRDDILVKGTVTNTTGNETGVTVNGVVATVYGNQFIANHVPLTEGSNTIIISATDTAGNIATTSITVNAVTTGNYIRLTSNIESGISPLEVTLKVDGTFSFDESIIGGTGPAQPEFLYTSADEYRIKMTVEGIYYLTVSVTDINNVTYTDTIAIVVLNKSELDTLLRGKWEGMKGAMAAKNINEAVGYLIGESREQYSQAFNYLLDSLPDIANSMQNIEIIYLKGTVSKYRIRRIQIIENTSQEITYYIYFVKDNDGIWKLEKF